MAYFRKRGTSWEYRIKYNDAGKQKTISKSGFKTKGEARAAAVLVEEKLFKGGIKAVRKGDILFEDWLERYRQIQDPHRRSSSNHTVKNSQDKILTKFAGYRLKDIRRDEYQIFINDLLFKQNYSKNTVDRVHGEMMALLNSAVKHKELESNDLKGIMIRKDEDKKVVFLNKDEVLKLLEVIEKEDAHKRVMVLLLLGTGIRSGELLGLEWKHVDFENKTISIEQQRNFDGVGPLKTESSYRTIAIGDDLTNDLLEYKEWQENNEENNKFYFESNYVMVDEKGKPFYYTKPQDIMLSMLKKSGLTERKSTHLLRHTHAVMMLEAGADLKTVSERLGHADIQTTANIYLHVSSKHERKTVNLFENYLKND